LTIIVIDRCRNGVLTAVTINLRHFCEPDVIADTEADSTAKRYNDAKSTWFLLNETHTDCDNTRNRQDIYHEYTQTNTT